MEEEREPLQEEIHGDLNATSAHGDAHVHYHGLVPSVLPERLWKAFRDIAAGISEVVDELLINRRTKEQWLKEGQKLIQCKSYEKALRVCENALRLVPNDIVALVQKGATLEHLGRHEEA